MKDMNLDIGLRIGQIRREHKMTQEVLAEKLDVTVKHISAVERGLSSLSMDKCVELCKIFDCSMDTLILGRQCKSLESKLPNTIVEILSSDNDVEIDRLQRFLRFYLELREW